MSRFKPRNNYDVTPGAELNVFCTVSFWTKLVSIRCYKRVELPFEENRAGS
ncbi:hypothetical protein BIW11_08791 [Tropilaelaps mercedesae]|uniref:Uncharacterized protein n=1 Tax=Tropilaelaps mercedesae TaxID=418985 RepID=A0A1V9XN14_9ACAR|nr:hypothetical protein BIW11_08791 [Tropilaelaps mercedesae]